MSRGPSQASYLEAAGTGFLTARDRPAGPAGGRAVLIVPPFGWDEVASYRPRRAWARHLADAGADVLRIDLPGTGDSAGGPHDADLVDAWTEAVAVAARRLAAGGGRLTVLGIGLGGLLAWRAIAAGAPADELVLWGAPSRGRGYVRELKAFARLERSKLQELNPGRELPADQPDALTAAGHTLTAPTTELLGTLDVDALALPDRLRVLALGRDGVGPDDRLLDAARRAGGDVRSDPGHGWAELVAPPQESALSAATVAVVDAWLAAGDAPPAREPGTAPLGATELVTPEYRERPLIAGGAEGVLTEPPGDAPPRALLLLLNAGAIRRIGPNRMWVEIARRWAQRGVASLRLDLPGIGEADGDDVRDDATFYRPHFEEAAVAALQALPGDRYGAAPVGALGLCSGAWWSLELTVHEPRVQAAFALNTRALVWDPAIRTDRDARKISYLTRASTYRRVLRGDLPLSRGLEVARALVARAAAGAAARLKRRGALTAPQADPVDALLDSLRDDGKRTYLLFTGNEPVHDELRRSGRATSADRWPTLRIDAFDDLGDIHTLHPPTVQREVHRRVDAAIERDLAP